MGAHKVRSGLDAGACIAALLKQQYYQHVIIASGATTGQCNRETTQTVHKIVTLRFMVNAEGDTDKFYVPLFSLGDLIAVSQSSTGGWRSVGAVVAVYAERYGGLRFVHDGGWFFLEEWDDRAFAADPTTTGFDGWRRVSSPGVPLQGGATHATSDSTRHVTMQGGAQPSMMSSWATKASPWLS